MYDHTTEERRRAWRFFLDHAGYATPPGRAACALDLARAEQLIQQACDLSTAYVDVLDDPDGTIDGTYPACAVIVGIYEPGGIRPSYHASLGGIEADADPAYLRVVRAELASELVDELRQVIGDTLDAREQLCA